MVLKSLLKIGLLSAVLLAGCVQPTPTPSSTPASGSNGYPAPRPTLTPAPYAAPTAGAALERGIIARAEWIIA